MVMSPRINSGEPPVALKKAACAGRITLAQAQQAIAENWTIALRRLGLRPGPEPSSDLDDNGYLTYLPTIILDVLGP
jgi:hypothetical protein